ncbi:MAG: anthranilate synthase component I [Deltaproteobacteria bacterium]|nr:anthranilate synthase component I [Deltaproteobacteria bacterium]
MTDRHSPDFDAFCALARQGNLVPVYREILADLDTPVSAFLKLDEGGDAFLLESVQGGETWARYSFLGVEPTRVLSGKDGVVQDGPAGGPCATRPNPDPLLEARALLADFTPVHVDGLPRFTGGLVGFLAYDIVRSFERLPARTRDDLRHPDFYLMLAETLVIFDNVAQSMKVVAHARIDATTDLRAAYDGACARIESLIARLRRPVTPPPSPPPVDSPPLVRSNFEPAAYEAIVERAKEYIRAGDIIQVVLAQRFECARRANPIDIYRCLRTFNPSPYMYFLRVGGRIVLGTSPEVMARLEGRELTVRPIAGTRPRGTDERLDRELERELVADPKEIAEHIMLVDLGRNDVGRVSEIGSVVVTERMVVERYSHVMHLVSNVRGTLRAGLDCFDAFRATFPAGTLSGAPKIRAMEIIEELEPTRRGVYGGAVGYFDFSGNMDTAIAIRTMVIDGDTIYAEAGAGIVADSDPEREHAECVNKARALFQAVKMAESM